MSKCEGERRLWAAVHEAVFSDCRRTLNAARKRDKSVALLDRRNHALVALDAEIKEAVEYFQGKDWRIICDFTGREESPRQLIERALSDEPTPYERMKR